MNNIQTHKETIFNELDGDDNESVPWIAQIDIGPIKYEARGETEEKAIKALYDYIEWKKTQLELQLKQDMWHLEYVYRFLQTQKC